MRSAVVALVLVACGDRAPAPDAGAAPCTATFTGNFTETSATAANCPIVRSGGLIATDLALDAEIAIAAIDTSIGVTIDLGATPTLGPYSSETTTVWSALAVARVPTGECIFNAGENALPAGSFTLMLDALDGASGHGTLKVVQYLLRYVDDQGHESDCGPGDTEELDLIF